MKTMENLKLNYLELGYIMDISPKEAKEIFIKELEDEKVKTKDEIFVKDLAKYFDAVKNVDARYDGQNKLLFNLSMKANNYKKVLSNKQNIKKKCFTGKMTVYNKILSDEQLKHAKETFLSHHRFLGLDKVKKLNE